MTLILTCPVCGSTVPHFQPLPPFYAANLQKNGWPHGLANFETLNLEAYTCPNCLSGDRDRLYCVFLERLFSNLSPSNTYGFLEIAPAAAFRRWVKSHPFISYRSCDLYMPEADDKADIHALPYPDGTYDFVVCSHVLEHVDDPVKAVSELHRVLKPGGVAILMVPILLTIEDTYENPAAVTAEDRWRNFGQDDHVRIFSKSGFVDTIGAGGFTVQEIRAADLMSADELERFGISGRSVIYLGLKDAHIPAEKADRPKVSVLVPAYNHEKYVVEAVDSILAQSFQDFELLMMDDGSTDGTPDKLRLYEDNPKVKLFLFEKNRGAAFSHNHGITESRGEYIALLNSDDVWEPGKLALQVAFLDANPGIGAVFSPATFIGEEGQPLQDHEHYMGRVFDQPNRSRHEWLQFFFMRNGICHPSILIRRQCYEELGQYDPRFSNLPDQDMWIRLCMRYPIHVLPQPLVRFRIRAGETQASAQSEANIRRWHFEHKQLIRHYLAMPSMADFNAVFPHQAERRIDDKRLMPFYLAIILMTNELPPHCAELALDTLHDFMGSEANRELVERAHGFKLRDLFALTSGKAPATDILRQKEERQLEPV
jgi:SAM-dependent methyltransferase